MKRKTRRSPRRQPRAPQKQLRLLAAIIETSLDAVIIMDHAGKVVEFNPAAERMFGRARRDVMGRQMADLIIPPALRRHHREGLKRFLATGEGPVLGRRIEMPALRADGTEFPVELAVVPLSGNGRPRFVGHLRDLTDRRRVEQFRHARLAVTQVLAEHTTVPDAAPRVLEAVCENLGWDVGACWLVDRAAGVIRCLDIWHVPSRRFDDFERASREKVFAPGVGLPGRVWASGQPAWVPDVTQDDNFPRAPFAEVDGLHSAFASPLVVGTDVLGVIEFFSQEIREPDADVLETLATVGAQIGHFIERRRVEAVVRETLQEEARRKDEFLAMLAHELRNPLAPIANALHILGHPTGAGESGEQAREIAARQVEHMSRLLDDLLDLARISQGKIELRREPVDVGALVTRTVETSRALFEQRRLELTVSLPVGPVRVLGDSTRLEQVLTNLLHNAAKYTEPGGHVSLVADRDGPDVVWRVRDTGIGIPPELSDRIFEPFMQVERRLDRSRGGVGIGLTLVKRLVELHGGAVSAQSAGRGEGSEFTVRLPAVAAAHTEARVSESTVPVSGVASRRVLVVDDNYDAASSLAMLLQLDGHDVRVASDGPTALAVAQTFLPQMVLLDLGMPGMDGYEVARRLCERLDQERPMIVALTGWGRDEDRRRTRECGFSDHLIKPVSMDALHKLLAQSWPDSR